MKFKPGDLVEMRLFPSTNHSYAGVGLITEVAVFSCLIEWLQLPMPSYKKLMLVEEKWIRKLS